MQFLIVQFGIFHVLDRGNLIFAELKSKVHNTSDSFSDLIEIQQLNIRHLVEFAVWLTERFEVGLLESFTQHN